MGLSFRKKKCWCGYIEKSPLSDTTYSCLGILGKFLADKLYTQNKMQCWASTFYFVKFELLDVSKQERENFRKFFDALTWMECSVFLTFPSSRKWVIHLIRQTVENSAACLFSLFDYSEFEQSICWWKE